MSSSFTHLPFDEPRFWSKVNLDGPFSDRVGSNCWLWTAADNGKYGVFLLELGARWVMPIGTLGLKLMVERSPMECR